MSLEEKLQEHCTSVNITKKTVQRRFSTGQLGKGKSEEMCLQYCIETVVRIAKLKLFTQSGTSIFLVFRGRTKALQNSKIPNAGPLHTRA